MFLLLLHVINCNFILFLFFCFNFLINYSFNPITNSTSFFIFLLCFYLRFSWELFQISIQSCFEFVDNKAIKALVISSYYLSYLTSLWIYDYFLWNWIRLNTLWIFNSNTKGKTFKFHIMINSLIFPSIVV